MVFVGLAAALLMRVSDDGDLKTLLAKVDPSKQAYLTCITAQAAQRHQEKDSDQLAGQILAPCAAKLDTLVDAVAKAQGASPEAKAAAAKAIQPLLPALAHAAIKEAVQRAQAQAQKAAAAKAAEPDVITRHAPPPDPDEIDDRRVATPTTVSVPAGACGGVSVPTDPSALSCR
jgi:hypothetical protein